jgi:hypothetical protein
MNAQSGINIDVHKAVTRLYAEQLSVDLEKSAFQAAFSCEIVMQSGRMLVQFHLLESVSVISLFKS